MFVGDNDAFLFNLSSYRHFPSKQSGKDLYCSDDCGPCFSGGGGELRAWEPFNGEKMCGSNANKPGYGISIEGGVNMLTNK